ncbi:hypothetical protein [uncultured Desulfuromonas sp.]|uniref:hypothetical protein n=1 Tax=uncultured Desulfuromonas sp. TaxID=181013 RepID=UPI002AAAB31D|nr:hypothetical protein [uncultured Desulfuromonas sp.]
MIRLKVWMLLVVFVVLGVAVSVGPACSATIDVDGDAYVAVESMYLWRGFDLSPDSDFVVSGGVDLSTHGFTLSYWVNWDEKANKVNETDIGLDYSWDVNEMFSMSVGDVLYAVDSAEDTHELYVAVTANTLLSPTLTAYWDWDEAEEEGLFYTLDLSQDVALGDTLALLLGGQVSYNQHSDFSVGDYSAFHNAELSVALDWAVHEQISVTPLVRFSTPLSDEADDIAEIDDEIYTGISVLLSF